MKPAIAQLLATTRNRLAAIPVRRPLVGLCLGLVAMAGNATVITSLANSEPIPFKQVTGPTGLNTTSGPVVDGRITWTADTGNEPGISVYGYRGPYGFVDNGNWQGLSMIGVNNDTGSMTVTFRNPVSAVLAFLNYAAFNGQPTGTAPSIAVYDAGNNLIESLGLNFLTGGGVNTGRYFGFSEAGAIIKSMTFAGSFIGAADLRVAKVSEPSALALLGLGLMGAAVARRRRQA